MDDFGIHHRSLGNDIVEKLIIYIRSLLHASCV